MQQLLLWQFLSHILSDFYLQSDSFCKNKECKAFCSWQLYAHIVIVFAIAWLFSFSLGFWKTALIIAGTHLLFDGLKGLTHNLKWHFKHKALAQFVTRRVQRAFFMIRFCIWSSSWQFVTDAAKRSTVCRNGCPQIPTWLLR